MVSLFRPKWAKSGTYYYNMVRLGGGRKSYIVFQALEDDDVEVQRFDFIYEDKAKELVRKLNGWNK